MADERHYVNETLAGWYVKESGGDLEKFVSSLRHSHRLGQSFFNALTCEDQDKLRGGLHDPYYGGISEVMDAVDFLTGGK